MGHVKGARETAFADPRRSMVHPIPFGRPPILALLVADVLDAVEDGKNLAAGATSTSRATPAMMTTLKRSFESRTARASSRFDFPVPTPAGLTPQASDCGSGRWTSVSEIGERMSLSVGSTPERLGGPQASRCILTLVIACYQSTESMRICHVVVQGGTSVTRNSLRCFRGPSPARIFAMDVKCPIRLGTSRRPTHTSTTRWTSTQAQDCVSAAMRGVVKRAFPTIRRCTTV